MFKDVFSRFVNLFSFTNSSRHYLAQLNQAVAAEIPAGENVLPEPKEALREPARVLKKGGRILYTGPLFYEEHEQPRGYYRYTQFALKHLFAAAGFEIRELGWLEGYAGTVAYQLTGAGYPKNYHVIAVKA